MRVPDSFPVRVGLPPGCDAIQLLLAWCNLEATGHPNSGEGVANWACAEGWTTGRFTAACAVLSEHGLIEGPEI
jgi:hypothetical protein